MRRIRRRVKKRIVIVTLCVLAQIAFIFLCHTVVKQMTEKRYEALIGEKDTILQEAMRTVYITSREIKAGELLTNENVEMRCLLSEQNPESLAVDAIGMTACADLPEGVILNTSMCSENECAPSERKCVYYNIGFAECFTDYEVVDVRLRYANGENYCVLKKKRIRKLEEEEEACYFYLTEDEQLFMSAAQYDVEMYSGAELYVVGFMEERLQEDAISDYLPSVQIISQLREWKEEYRESYARLCDLRTALEKRLIEHRRLRLEELL